MSRKRERFDEIGEIKREADVASQILMAGRRQHHGAHPVTLNTITPCAACKLLRRRCAQECPFAPYFSPHEPHKFASVHKVFGASNVSKMLMEVPESQRADTANSLVYEANVRLRDPVYGCMGAISALQQQVQALQAELNAVRAEILKQKHLESNLLHPPHTHIALLSSGAVSMSTQPQPLPPPPETPPTHIPNPPPLRAPPTATPSPTVSRPPNCSSSTGYNAMDYSTLTSENVSSYFGCTPRNEF